MTRAESKARTRELLIEAAARTFAKKGFHGASVDEIAEGAGFSVGALYANFSGKEQLFLELLGSRASEHVAAAERMLADSDEAAGPAPIDAIGTYLVELADTDGDFAPLQAEFWLYAVRNPEVMHTLADRMRESHDALTRLLEAHPQHAQLPPGVHPDTVSTLVFALFQGLMRQRKLDPASVPAELFGRALRWLLAGMRVHADGQLR